MKRSVKSVAILASAFVLSPLGSGSAQAATTLTFSGDICGVTGNQSCASTTQIGQNYGDGTGVNVSYRSITLASNTTYEANLRHWSAGYGDLSGVVYGGGNGIGYASEITFAALPGYELTLLGFDAACYQNRVTCRSFPFSITEIGGATAASGSNTPPSGGHVSQAFSLAYSSTGYVLRWGPDGYDGGLDNITFDVRAIAGGAVPEPSTWAMMLLGFGAIGAAARRRRATNAQLRLA